MRRFLKWALITLGIAALVRKLRSRRQAGAEGPSGSALPTPPPVAATTPESEDPAGELRRRLADTRETEVAPGETAVDDRRAEVHDQGRSAIDEMRSSAADE